MTTFRELIDTAARAGRADHLPPRTRAQMAKRIGISLPHIYTLLNGSKAARPWTVATIARGLDIPTAVVADAIRESREAFVLTNS